ncbi:hypothetical protein [Paenibacillus sp. PSB04]|uniref:hypothetical protein n=1 Tax=Paenibacillus sp. PSB04 TaxID=2866810 RepID=UPI0021F1D1D4|nr:hypothetical protein [Paenibacillus sp. PSB04]UYO06712.1 hypothetical protein K2F33_12995 [Paenibacillus sp. PSB04]
MGWSELRAVPNDYDEEIHAVDTQLIELLNHRKALAKGRRCFPPKEVMKEFEEKFGLKPPYLNWLFHSINGGFHRPRSDGPGELQGILQIMKTTVQEGYQYRITHAMSMAVLYISRLNSWRMRMISRISALFFSSMLLAKIRNTV